VVVLTVGFCIWLHWWTTAAVFDYSLRALVALEGRAVYPDDFLDPAGDMEKVSAYFQNPEMEVAAGLNSVPLTLTRGWRTVETTATLYLLAPLDCLQIEFAAEGQYLNPELFLLNADITGSVSYDVRFLSQMLPPEDYPVGQFLVQLLLNEDTFFATLDVVDTTPPTATPVNKTIQMSEEVVADDFVTDIFDASPITSVAFATEPDVFAAGDQVVEIEIDDVFGNRGSFKARLTVLPNEVPPTIGGVRNIDSMVGNTIIYRRGVEAYDAFGRALDINVDSSGVNQNTVGMYTATYWVVDCCGLRTEIEIDVNIVSVDPQWVDERVDGILEVILQEGMTQVEQARAIFTWVRRNISYASGITRTYVYEGAFQALQNRHGNCFIYYSISEVMLTRADIPNMRIERIPGTPTRHNWSLINPDGMGWYHFDATMARFMFTNSQAANYTRQTQLTTGQQNFYTFNPSLYPEIVP
jgi:transglutaminase-like putative cysteine protease